MNIHHTHTHTLISFVSLENPDKHTDFKGYPEPEDTKTLWYKHKNRPVK